MKSRSVPTTSQNEKFPCLIQYSGQKLGQRFDLDADSIVIGSAAEADLVIPEPSVLPKHARITRTASGFNMENLETNTDISIDSKPISGCTPMADGSILQIGEVIFKFFEDFNPPRLSKVGFEAYQNNPDFTKVIEQKPSNQGTSILSGSSLLLASLTLVAAAIYLAGIDLSSILKLTPLLLLIGTTSGLMLTAFPIHVHLKSAQLALTDKFATRDELSLAINYFNTLGHMGLLSGFLCFLIAMAGLMMQIHSPGTIGLAVAIGILCLAYGFVVRMLCFVKSEHLRDLANTMARDRNTCSQSYAGNNLPKNRAA